MNGGDFLVWEAFVVGQDSLSRSQYSHFQAIVVWIASNFFTKPRSSPLSSWSMIIGVGLNSLTLVLVSGLNRDLGLSDQVGSDAALFFTLSFSPCLG